MFHEDAIYASARTCSRELGFVSLSPCQSHVLFHIFLQIFFHSHFQNGQDTSPNLSVNSPRRNSPTFFSKSGTNCWGQVERTTSAISLLAFPSYWPAVEVLPCGEDLHAETTLGSMKVWKNLEELKNSQVVSHTYDASVRLGNRSTQSTSVAGMDTNFRCPRWFPRWQESARSLCRAHWSLSLGQAQQISILS